MPQELIINILGNASINALSTVTACISEHDCNILDSRHALYGTDFSLTMIVSGSTSDVTLLELALSNICMNNELLCLMKRTSGHQKQNIDQVIQLTFSGQDSNGLMQKVTSTVAACGLTINALRQKTDHLENVLNNESSDKGTSHHCVTCKMILSAPETLDLNAFKLAISTLLKELGLRGQINHNTQKENHEYIESW